jgi:hypothetical protein
MIMVKRTLAALLLLFGLGLQGAFATPTNLVVNGDFELGGPGSVPGWTMAPDPASLGIGGQSVAPDFSFSPTPHSGKVFIDMAYEQVGLLSQLLGTTAGAVYTLEFDLQRFDTSGGDIDNYFRVMFNGVQLMQETNVGADWMHFSFAGLTASGASTLLEFGNRNYWDFNALDNVSVVQTSRDPNDPGDPRDLPEPGTAAMLALGLGLLARAHRRQQS